MNWRGETRSSVERDDCNCFPMTREKPYWDKGTAEREKVKIEVESGGTWEVALHIVSLV